MNNNEWKLPLNLAIGLHVLLALVAIYMPGLFRSKPILPDITTVNLVNLAEPPGPKSDGGPKQESAPKKLEASKPEVKIKPVEINKPTPPPEPVVKPQVAPVPISPPAPNVTSLNPLKKKIEKDAKIDQLINERIRKLELQEKREKEIERRKELETIRKRELIEASKAERVAEEARSEAEELRKLMSSSSNVQRTTSNGSSGSQTKENEGHSSGSNVSALESQYQAAIFKRLQQFWSLPEFKKWDPTLTAIVVITINKDGTITNQFFEKRSGDKVFDQFVEKTLHDAAPLPAIPEALRKAEYEIGLRFRPSGIQ